MSSSTSAQDQWYQDAAASQIKGERMVRRKHSEWRDERARKADGAAQCCCLPPERPRLVIVGNVSGGSGSSGDGRERSNRTPIVALLL